MSAKSFIAGAATIALPVALVMGVLHFTHEWPVIAAPPVLVRQIVLQGHCMKPPLAPAPAKRRHIDDGAP